MNIDALIASLRAKYLNLPKNQQQIVKPIAAFLMLLIAIILFKSCSMIASHKKVTVLKPLLVRQGDTIFIPSYSALRKEIKLATALKSNKPHIVTLPGIIEAQPMRTVNVQPPMAGRLLSLKIQLGDSVKANQVLATLASPGLTETIADNEKAKSALKQYAEALKRAEKANKVGANSIKDIELAQSNYEQALAEFIRVQKTLKILESNRSHQLSIKAPIGGFITAINYGIGSFINDPAQPLLTITNTRFVWLTAYVPENLVSVVKKNYPVIIHILAYPKHDWKAHISFVNSLIEPDTRMNKSRILLPNPDGKLQPNMFGNILISVPEHDKIVIPTSAILMNDDSTVVYVETSPWTLKKREVELGSEDGNSVQILSGLKVGERIAISGGVLVNDQ